MPISRIAFSDNYVTSQARIMARDPSFLEGRPSPQPYRLAAVVTPFPKRCLRIYYQLRRRPLVASFLCLPRFRCQRRLRCH